MFSLKIKNLFSIGIAIVLIMGFGVVWQLKKEPEVFVASFEDCVAAGNPVMESYPRQCRHGKQTFVENIGNELEKANLIRLHRPRPNIVIKSPLVIEGTARGYWFFEADFPVTLVDKEGKIVAQGIATAQEEWMTQEFVPFHALLEFELPAYKNSGTLILHKDNPSGLLEHDDALRVPVFFEKKM
jgi:hypothetical protein